MSELGADLNVSPSLLSGPTRETQPSPSIEDHPVRELPAAADAHQVANAAALVAACEGLVFRALERAGNRLRAQNSTKPPGVPNYETHLFIKANGSAGKVLEDAWSCAPMILSGVGDAEKIVPVLDSYCRSLLAEQSPHKRERLVNWLRSAEQVPA